MRRLREERTAREHGVQVGPFGYLGSQPAGRDSGWRLGKRGVIGVRVRERRTAHQARGPVRRRPSFPARSSVLLVVAESMAALPGSCARSCLVGL
jgi:hypothetical protein